MVTSRFQRVGATGNHVVTRHGGPHGGVPPPTAHPSRSPHHPCAGDARTALSVPTPPRAASRCRPLSASPRNAVSPPRAAPRPCFSRTVPAGPGVCTRGSCPCFSRTVPRVRRLPARPCPCSSRMTPSCIRRFRSRPLGAAPPRGSVSVLLTYGPAGSGVSPRGAAGSASPGADLRCPATSRAVPCLHRSMCALWVRPVHMRLLGRPSPCTVLPRARSLTCGPSERAAPGGAGHLRRADSIDAQPYQGTRFPSRRIVQPLRAQVLPAILPAPGASVRSPCAKPRAVRPQLRGASTPNWTVPLPGERTRGHSPRARRSRWTLPSLERARAAHPPGPMAPGRQLRTPAPWGSGPELMQRRHGCRRSDTPPSNRRIKP